MSADRHGLERFVSAQRNVYAAVLDELRTGRKTSHWMWFVFPQLRGLGRSSTAQHYAITGLDETRSYLAHPLLGPRLLECTRLVRDAPTDTAEQFFGPVDALKLRSSLTLFGRVAADDELFAAVLDRYFDGRPDPATERLLDA